MLRDRRFGKGAVDPDSLTIPGIDVPDIPTPAGNESMVFLNPPDYTRLRGLVSKAFTPRRVEQLRPWVESFIDQLLDRVAEAGTIDVMDDFAFELPVHVIGELVGVPPEDREQFRRLIPANAMDMELQCTPEEHEAAHRARIELFTYFGGLIYQRRRDPRDDLVTALIKVRDGGDKLTDAS